MISTKQIINWIAFIINLMINNNCVVRFIYILNIISLFYYIIYINNTYIYLLGKMDVEFVGVKQEFLEDNIIYSIAKVLDEIVGETDIIESP